MDEHEELHKKRAPLEWSESWIASVEVAREIQPVKNERTVLPTPGNVNDFEGGTGHCMVQKKKLPRVPHARGSRSDLNPTEAN
jgi:hypothetical protein